MGRGVIIYYDQHQHSDETVLHLQQHTSLTSDNFIPSIFIANCKTDTVTYQ